MSTDPTSTCFVCRKHRGEVQIPGGAVHVCSFVLEHHVPHLHIHVVPLYPGTPPEYGGWRVDEWPEAPRGGPPEMAAVCARRDHLQRSGPSPRVRGGGVRWAYGSKRPTKCFVAPGRASS